MLEALFSEKLAVVLSSGIRVENVPFSHLMSGELPHFRLDRLPFFNLKVPQRASLADLKSGEHIATTLFNT